MPSSPPIEAIPPEILFHVFSYLIPTYLATLQLVCKMWRDLLHQRSRLWTGISIVPHPTIPLIDGLEMASRRAGRSGMLPLSISWKLGLKEDELTNEIKTAIMEFFRRVPPSRWFHLSLLDTSGIPEEILKSEFSSLKFLNVQTLTEGINLSLLDAIDQTATSIEVLRVVGNWAVLAQHVLNILNRVVGIEILDAEVEPDLPENILRLKLFTFPEYLYGMQNLTSLTVERMDLPLIVDNELLALVSLDVGSATYDSGIEIDTDTTLNLPSLLHLRMPGNAPYLLTSIVAPKLQNLRMQEVWSKVWDEEDESLCQEMMIDQYQTMLFLNKFPHSIESLTLAYQLDANIIFPLVVEAIKVRKLDVTIKGLTEAATLFKALVPHLEGVILPDTPEELDWDTCPDLTSLVFRYKGCPGTKDLIDKMCEDFFEFRSFAGLKRLKFVVGDVTEKILVIGEKTEQN